MHGFVSKYEKCVASRVGKIRSFEEVFISGTGQERVRAPVLEWNDQPCRLAQSIMSCVHRYILRKPARRVSPSALSLLGDVAMQGTSGRIAVFEARLN
jgi:hypothetical protein